VSIGDRAHDRKPKSMVGVDLGGGPVVDAPERLEESFNR
jgi:hypothetical protein